MNPWLKTVVLAVAALALHPLATRASELLLNPGFESPALQPDSEADTDPAEWTVFSSTGGSERVGLSSKTAKAGKQSARLRVQNAANSFQGMYQSFQVKPGETYRFAIYASNDAQNPLKGTARGQISIEWKNAAGEEIERVWGPDWGATLPQNAWSAFEMTATAPANAARVHFVITQFDGVDPHPDGAFLADEASVKARP